MHILSSSRNHDNLQVQVELASVFPNFFLSRGFLTYNEKKKRMSQGGETK